ncbi:MAG: ABC transporter ATP-binding protein [Halobacteriales archaeon]|nr:ABC transporter ATP-binding protein [Halobacteriales archaeon]
MAADTSTVVQLDSITKRFRDVTAVDDIDVSIRDGELLTLLGPSGCGKTTTLRMIAGFETPSEGTVYINNQQVTDTPAYNRDTGMVFQHYALFPHMNVADNIAFGLEMQGLPDGEIEERVEDALAMVRLEGLGDRYPSELSGGQQQRVALARALVIQPSVMLLDEPLSDLDKKLREEMRLEILRLHRELDVTMVYVTHNQEEALTISDRMAVMSEGEIHQVGTPEEVYQEPNDEFVADFIGNANLVTGTIGEVNEASYTVDINGQSFTLDAETGERATIEPGREVTLLFRPERFSIHPSDHDSEAENSMLADIQEVTYLGSRIDYFVEAGGEELQVVQQNIERHGGFEQGESITLTFSPDAPFAIPGDRT